MISNWNFGFRIGCEEARCRIAQWRVLVWVALKINGLLPRCYLVLKCLTLLAQIWPRMVCDKYTDPSEEYTAFNFMGKIQAIRYFETSVNYYQTTPCYIPEGGSLCRQSLESMKHDMEATDWTKIFWDTSFSTVTVFKLTTSSQFKTRPKILLH